MNKFSNEVLAKELRRPMATDHELEAARRIIDQAARIAELVTVLEDVKRWPYEMSQAKLNRINAAIAKTKE
jgi:hypothetical protein